MAISRLEGKLRAGVGTNACLHTKLGPIYFLVALWQRQACLFGAVSVNRN